MNSNQTNEKINNLVEEIKSIAFDTEFSLSKKELKSLKARIQDKNEIKRGFLSGLPFGNIFAQHKLAFMSVIALLFVGVAALIVPTFVSNTVQENAKFAVLSTFPNLETAPHPIFLPIEIVFNKTDIDLEKLKNNIDLEPDVAFNVEIDSQDPYKILIVPVSTFEPNLQYKVTILKGIYGLDYELTEDYTYYFLTQSDSSSQLTWETMFWIDSFYNEKHEYDLLVSEYISKSLNIPDYPENVDVTVYKTTNEEAYRQIEEFSKKLIQLKGEKYLVPMEYSDFELNKEVSQEISTQNVPVQKDKYGWNVKTDLPITEKGVYFVEVKAFDKVLKSNFVLINTYGTQSRTLVNDHYVIAQSFQNSEVLPNTKIDGYVFKKDIGLVRISQLTTNENGQVQFANTPEDKLDLILSDHNGELAINSQHFQWHGYIVDRSDQPNYGADYYKRKYYVITDRELYKPGEKVQFKVISRENKNDNWEISRANAALEVNYWISQEEKNFTKELVFDENGSAWGEFIVPTENISNVYLGIKEPDFPFSKWQKSLDIVNFDKPQYEVNVELDKKVYQNGDEVKATISATQYDGTIVRGQSILVNIDTDYMWFQEAEKYNVCDRLAQYNYTPDRHLNYYDSKRIELDDNGTAQVTFKINEAVINNVAELTVSATLGDVYGPQSVGSTSTLFHPSQKYIHTYTNTGFNEIGAETYLNIEILDQNCQKVNESSGSYHVDKVSHYENFREQLTPFTNGTFTTNNFGKSEIPITFTESGHYKVTTKAPSLLNDEVIASKYVWVFDKNERSLYKNNQNTIAVELDKEEYKVGDIATATVFHPGFSGNMWFTINRNALHENKIVRMSAYQTEIQFEIKEQYVPTANFEIGLFSNNTYYHSELIVRVDESFKEVNIDINSDKDSYSPGETVTLTLQTTNLGNPVLSNLTIAVVDKSVLDLQRDKQYWSNNSLMGTFYNQYHANLTNNHSLRRVDVAYWTGGMGAGGGSPRSILANTAYWNPSISTDANGMAKITFTLPDNLTKWGIAVWAVTNDTKVGEAESYIQTAKDLKIQTFIPEQIMLDEKLELSAKVYNSTQNSQDFNLLIRTPDSIGVEGPNSVPLSLNPGESKEIKWFIIGKTASTNNKIVIETEGGSEYDGIESSINVIAQTYNSIQSFSGYGSNDFSFNSISEDSNQMNITVINSFELLMQYYANYVDFEYNILNSTIAHNVYKDNPTFVTNGEGQVEKYKASMNNINNYLSNKTKSSTGGYGYSDRYDASPNDTTDVFTALAHAVNEGFMQYSGNAESTLQWLLNNSSSLSDNAFILYLQTEYYKRNDVKALFAQLYSARNELSDLGIASLAVSARNLNESEEFNILIDMLITRAIKDGNAIHWKTSEYFGEVSDIDTNALALYALSKSNKLDEAKLASYWILNDHEYYFAKVDIQNFSILNKAFIEFTKQQAFTTSSNWILTFDNTVVFTGQNSVDTFVSQSFENIAPGLHEVKVINGGTFPFVKVEFKERSQNKISTDSPTLDTKATLRNVNGGVINSLKEGEYGLLAFELNSNTPVSEANIKTFIPSGLEVIHPRLSNSVLPDEIARSEYYKRNSQYDFTYLNGEINTDTYIYSSGQNQVLLIPVRARAKGTFMLGPINVYVKQNYAIHEVLEGMSFSVN